MITIDANVRYKRLVQINGNAHEGEFGLVWAGGKVIFVVDTNRRITWPITSVLRLEP